MRILLSLSLSGVAFVLLFAPKVNAEDWQFLFDATGNLIVQTAEINQPPQILGQPQNQVVRPGEPASFSVVAANTRGLTYQWFFNGTSLPDATADALLFTSVNATNEGLYSVVLVNSSGSVTSAPAMLMIDSDADGLADSWELANFGNLSQYPTRDFDGDGVSNHDEFLDGTSPTNSASVRFRLTILTDGGAVEAAPAGQGYTNGEVVTLTAVASGSERFRGWTGDIVSRSNSITLTMTNHKTLFAYFNPVIIFWGVQADGNWDTPSNWRPTLVPGEGDTVVIDVNRSIAVSGTHECANLLMSAGTITGTGTLTLHGASTWSGGVMGGNGRVIIAPGATLNIGGAPDVYLSTGRRLENGGTVLWTSGNIGAGTAVITNLPGALFEVRNAAGLNFATQPGSRFDNAGIFRKLVSGGTTTVFNGMSFNNSGTVEIQVGTLSLNGGGTSTGAFNVPAGATLNLSGTHSCTGSSSITGEGNLTVSSGPTITLAGLVHVTGNHNFTGGTVNLNGNYISTNNSILISGGTVNFNGTGTVMPAILNLGGSGTLGGTGVVTVASLMNWTGGVMRGNGRTIIAPGATLTIGGASDVFLATGRRLENGGTILWTSGNIGVSAAVITNRAGALFEVRNAAGLNFATQPSSRFDNAGTFRKSVSAGTTTVFNGMSFNNYNTVEVRRGILRANGGYTFGSAALLNCALGGTTAGSGFGQLQVSGAVNLNGSLSVDLTNGFVPSTNDTFAVLTATARNATFANFYFPSNEVTMQLSNSPAAVIVRITDVFAVHHPMLLQPEISGSDIRLIWTAVSNTTYRLEFNPDLNPSNWTALPGDVTTLSNTASKLDALTPTNRFYRVRVAP